MKSLILASLLLLPLAAHADNDNQRRCEHSQPRNLRLDLQGVKTVVFDLGANELDLHAAPGASGRIDGRACASKPELLERMTVSQTKAGDRLTVLVRRNGNSDEGANFNFDLLGISFNRYAYLALKASVPDDLAVELKLGSGDAAIDGVRAASADVGSGDLKATRIRDRFSVSVDSGDLVAADIGTLHVTSIGSGDASIKLVRGASEVGSIGSGDLDIHGTQGPVEIGSVGSGDIDLRDIGGSVSVGSIGSGDIDVNGVHGDLTVRSKGSGDIDHRNVEGRISLPKKR